MRRQRGGCVRHSYNTRSARASNSPVRTNSLPADTDTSEEETVVPIHNMANAGDPMNMDNAGNPGIMGNSGNPMIMGNGNQVPCNRPNFCRTLVVYSILIIAACVLTVYVVNVKNINFFDPREEREEPPVDVVQKILRARDETARMVEEIHKMFHDREAKPQPKVKKKKAQAESIWAPKDKKSCDVNQRWNTDCIGTPDYALESAGASIVTTRNTIDFDSGGQVRFLGWVLCGTHLGARAMLQPDNMPGNCWAFEGTEGTAVIRLVGSIYINCVSLEHIKKEISPYNDVSSAPKLFMIYGLGCRESEGHLLGEFVYDIEGPPIQCFYITQKTHKPVQFIEVKFASNHGRPDFTCVYKIRVHGDRKKPNVIR